jgi:hypothetical protein
VVFNNLSLFQDILTDKTDVEKSKTKEEEDSDEEQFEESDDDDSEEQDEIIQTSPIVVNQTALEAEQAAAKERHMHKFAEEQHGKQLVHKQTIKSFDLGKAKVIDEDVDKDDDEEDSEIEMIEPDSLFVRKEMEPSYAKHDPLIAEGVSSKKRHDLNNLLNFQTDPQESNTVWSTSTTLIVYLTLILCVLAIAAIVMRLRPVRQGFIEAGIIINLV